MEENNPKKKYLVPLSEKGWPRWSIYLVAVLGLVYLLNPTAGYVELLPDYLPIVGNIDEGAAAIALWYGVLELLSSRKK